VQKESSFEILFSQLGESPVVIHILSGIILISIFPVFIFPYQNFEDEIL